MSRMSLRSRGSRKASDKEKLGEETLLRMTRDDDTSKRTSKMTEKMTELVNLRPRRSRKALNDDTYDFSAPLSSDNDGKHKRIIKQKMSNSTSTEATLPFSETKIEESSAKAPQVTVTTKMTAKGTRKRKAVESPVASSSLAVVTTTSAAKRTKKYDYFDKLSDDLILCIFKFIANPLAKGPLGTYFENVYGLCRFRILLSSNKTSLLREIKAEKWEMGNCCLSTCKDVYRIYEKDLIQLQPRLCRNPAWKNGAPMKLYPKFVVIKLCLKKYGSADMLKYYQDKKKQNRANKRATRPVNNDVTFWGWSAHDTIPRTQVLPKGNVTNLVANRNTYNAYSGVTRNTFNAFSGVTPKGNGLKNLRCDICADNRLFCAVGLRDHSAAKHKGIQRSSIREAALVASADNPSSSSSSSVVGPATICSLV